MTTVFNMRSARPGTAVVFAVPARDWNEEIHTLARRWFRFGKKQEEAASTEAAVDGGRGTA